MILALAVVSGAMLLSEGVPGRPVPVDRAQLLKSVMLHVEHNYIDSTDLGVLYGMTIQGMLRALGDAHAAYVPADRLSALRERASGDGAGPGLDVDERDGWIVVVAAFVGSPAFHAGVRTGDRVVAVNGRQTYGMSSEEVRQAIQGRPGSQVELVVERPGVADDMAISLLRQRSPERTLRAAFRLTDDVGYVRLDRFSRRTAGELAAAIDSLHRTGISSVVVDLRGNPGGPPEAGVAVADLFLPSGVGLASTRGRSSATEQDFVDGSAARWSELELILLVDEGTANASEVAAGALQDLDRALVVGRHTFGRGSKQELISLSDGGAVMLTTSRWYTALGRRIEPETNLPRARRPTSGDPDANRPEHKTALGRTVLGGGGIRPDVLVRRVVGDAESEQLPIEMFVPGQAQFLVQRDAFVRVAVLLATQANGQPDLFARAQALGGADADEGGGIR